jgi:hypothetical protein
MIDDRGIGRNFAYWIVRKQKCSVAPILVFRGKIKKIKNMLAQIKEIKKIFNFLMLLRNKKQEVLDDKKM